MWRVRRRYFIFSVQSDIQQLNIEKQGVISWEFIAGGTWGICRDNGLSLYSSKRTKRAASSFATHLPRASTHSRYILKCEYIRYACVFFITPHIFFFSLFHLFQKKKKASRQFFDELSVYYRSQGTTDAVKYLSCFYESCQWHINKYMHKHIVRYTYIHTDV